MEILRQKVVGIEKQNHGPKNNRPDCGSGLAENRYPEGAIFVPLIGRRRPSEMKGFKIEEGCDESGKRGFWFIPLVERTLPQIYSSHGGGETFGGGRSKKAKMRVSSDRRNGRL